MGRVHYSVLLYYIPKTPGKKEKKKSGNLCNNLLGGFLSALFDAGIFALIFVLRFWFFVATLQAQEHDWLWQVHQQRCLEGGICGGRVASQKTGAQILPGLKLRCCLEGSGSSI